LAAEWRDDDGEGSGENGEQEGTEGKREEGGVKLLHLQLLIVVTL
jgi:hypothetical protein